MRLLAGVRNLRTAVEHSWRTGMVQLLCCLLECTGMARLVVVEHTVAEVQIVVVGQLEVVALAVVPLEDASRYRTLLQSSSSRC